MFCNVVITIVIIFCGNFSYLRAREDSQNSKNCTPSLGGMKILHNTSQLSQVNITWNSSDAIRCNYQFRVIKKSSLQPVTSISNYTQQNHYIQEIEPCTPYSFTVELSETGNNTILNATVQIWETDIPNEDKIQNFQFNSSTHSIYVSWTPHLYAEICNISYTISIPWTNSAIKVPYTRFEPHSTHHLITDLESCTKYNISVIPSGVLKTQEDQFIFPITTLPEKVEQLDMSVTGSSSTISWTPPKNTDCITKYYISSSVFDKFVTDTSFTSDQILYCIPVTVRPIASKKIPGEATELIKPAPVENLQVVPSDTLVEVTWNAPSNDKCTVAYLLYINSTEYPANETSLTVTNLTACGKYGLQVRSKSSNSFGNPVEKNFTMLEPKELDHVRNLTTIIRNGTKLSLSVTWLPPTGAQLCSLEYGVEVRDEKNNSILPKAITNNNSLSIDLSSALVCVTYKLSVTAMLNQLQSVTSEDVEISEEPEKISNLTLEVSNTSIITWTGSRNSNCLRGYKVSSSLFEIETNNTSYLANYTLDCIEVAVSPIRKDGSLGEATTVLKPGPVRELNVISADTSMSLTWKPPLNESCISGYSIHFDLNNSNPNVKFDDGIYPSQPQHTFRELIPCTPYKIKVRARTGSDDFSDTVVVVRSTTAPLNLGKVSNFKISKHGQFKLSSSWRPPLGAEACSIHYQVVITDEDGKSVFNETTENLNLNVNFPQAVFCSKYDLSVTSVVDQSRGKPYYHEIEIPSVRAAPKCTVVDFYPTEAFLQCNFTDFRRNKCLNSELIVDCENLNNSTRFKFREVMVAGPNQTLILKNLLELANYKCSVSINGSLGRSEANDSIEFMTTQAVPEAPQLQPIAISSNTSFDLNWNDDQSTKTQSYDIYIIPFGPTYFIPPDCKPKDLTNLTFPSNSTTFTFQEASPSSRYRVAVSGSNEAGMGATSNIQTITTKGGIPEEPRDIDFNVSTFETESYNVSVKVAWVYPCYTNGLMDYFEIKLNGKSYVGDNVTDHRLSQLIHVVDEKNPDLNYDYTAINLKPAVSYKISIKAVTKDKLESTPVPITFMSYESYPEAPVISKDFEASTRQFKINWREPLNKNGILKNYSVEIESDGPQYWIPQNCNIANVTYNFSVSPNDTIFEFKNGLPDHKYNVYIGTSTSIGRSALSEKLVVETAEEKSENVRDLKVQFVDFHTEIYNASVNITFGYPCHTYGTFKSFSVTLTGTGPNNYTEEYLLQQRSEICTHILPNLRPGYTYRVMVQVNTEQFINDGVEVFFKSSDGVPPVLDKITAPIASNSTAAEFVLTRNLFKNTNGHILYYALILGEPSYEEESKFGFWDGSYNTWPDIEGNEVKEMQTEPYQATPKFWNPFIGKNVTNTTVLLGINNDVFNKLLQPDKTYTFKVRGFTNNGYRDTQTVTFRTQADSKLALILGTTLGIFGTLGIIVLILFILRRRQKWTKTKNLGKPLQLTPIPVSISNFDKIYADLKNDGEKLKEEFALLTEKSGEDAPPICDAVLPENKKKNRYTNVLPYDDTRVKLLDNNDNDANDYINASYIKGYSGEVEYIATQGPLQHTVMDFWKMVMQENSSLIVMVAQFMEQNKDKCYKYFPAVHENMELENDIGIRCCTELDFKTHVVRTFLIQKDMQQWTVTHLQFTDWPDFGCPEGTEVILEFCRLMREHAERNPNPIIIHCSAGVGRTGTLIALDVLLQAINSKHGIDIFGTVLNLRRDRKNMVQTDKQYLFIYTCVDYALHNPEPIRYAVMSSDPIYENLDEIKKENMEEHIQESKF